MTVPTANFSPASKEKGQDDPARYVRAGPFFHSTSYAKGSSSLAGTLRGPAGVGTMTRQLGA